MPRVGLVSGPYQARSVIAGAQRCINLYTEENPDPQAPVPVTHYPTPGTTLFSNSPTVAGSRCVFRASNGDLFTVVGPKVSYVSPQGVFTPLGFIADLTTPVSMADNGLCLVIVDGTVDAYVVNLATRAYARINDPNFLGADRADYVDTYFVFNRPGTTQFYISRSLVSFAMLSSNVAGTAFDPLDIAGKTGSADNIVTVIAVHRSLWLIGALTSESWYNSGSADFTFAETPGAFVEHGCVARYSVAKQDVSAFWLSQDREGQGIVVQASGYAVSRISTHAIEASFQSYPLISDAIGYCFQQQGHAFYVLTFPSADRTWAYELQTGQWHELAWTDKNGALHRHRAGCCCFAYGKNLIGDWQSGAISALDPDAMTDNGNPITRIRSFPHLIDSGKRVTYRKFIVDLQTGTMPSTENESPHSEDFNADFSLDFGPIVEDPRNHISLRWSDTRGASWSNPITQNIGAAGDYLKSITFNRLGMARDRVFEISWSAPMRTALNGAFIETTAHET